MKLTRRGVLLGSAAVVGGVALGYYRLAQDPPNPLVAGDGDTVLTPYLIINADGVTVITPRAEMGQGIHSTLAALVAEELNLDWRQVRAVHGPASKAYYNPTVLAAALPFREYQHSLTHRALGVALDVPAKVLGAQITGGSTSTIDAFDKMRQAGAVARELLRSAAAQQWQVEAEQCQLQHGLVLGPNGLSAALAELAPLAASLPLPDDAAPKPRAQWQLLGKSLPRLDLAAKGDGSAVFGADVSLPDMLYAAIRMSPLHGNAVQSIDRSNVLSMPGVVAVHHIDEAVAVVADSSWRAFKAAAAVDILWRETHYPTGAAMHTSVIEALDADDADSTLRDDGDADTALAHADPDDVIAAEYRVPYLAHAAMEPINATAWRHDDGVEIWIGTQAPLAVVQAVAEALDIDEARVQVHVLLMGGSFGRRIETDVAVQAARLANRTPGRPVKLMWDRATDIQQDFYRPAAVARLQAVVGANGPLALRADVAGQSVMGQQGRRLLGFAPLGPDKLLVEGLFDQPYRIDHFSVNGHAVDLPVPVGTWRSVGHSHNAFFLESFLDEVALKAGLDPVAMRLAMLRDESPVSATVLQTAADMARWGSDLGPDRAQGVAFGYSFGSPCAQVVQLLQTPNGVKVEAVYCAMDVGEVLDQRNVEAQMMSSVVFGLSAAMSGSITLRKGSVDQSNFHDYPVMRQYQCPAIVTRVLENGERMGGAGEPATPSVMPALGNALFALNGTRLRSLPFSDEVRFL